MIGFAAVSAALALWQSQSQVQMQLSRVEERNLTQLLNQADSKATSIASDFLGGLFQVTASRGVVDTFQRAAHEAGVFVPSLSLRQTPSRSDQLGRLELTVTAQGSYAALKQLLAEWLDRFPSATVRSQQWHRVDTSGTSGAGPVVIEANWVLSVWTRPTGIEASTQLLSDASPLAVSTQSSSVAR